MGTFNEFSRIGLFSKMENSDLKSRIENYYGFINWVHNNTANELDLTLLWNNSLIESGIGYLDLGNMENPVDEILSDKSRRAILQNMIDNSIYLSSVSEGILTSLDELIIDIETEIQHK